MALIKFEQKPTIPKYPVGHEDFGYIKIPKLYDWTPAEKEWIEGEFKKHGVVERMDAIIGFAEKIVIESKAQKDTIDPEIVKQLSTRALALQVDDEDFNSQLVEIKRIAELIQKGKPELDLEYAVQHLAREDVAFMAQHYMGVIEFGKDQKRSREMRMKILVCAMIKFRYMEDPNDFDFDKYDQEVKEKNLPYPLREAIADFAENEKLHWVTQTQEDRDKELDLKKKLEKLSKQEKKETVEARSRSTGKVTTGD